MAHEMTLHDQALASQHIRLTLKWQASNSANIEFQFPPKLKEDGRDCEWQEKKAGPRTGDPVAIFKHGNSRKMTLEWTYIVGAGTAKDGQWTAGRIWNQLSFLRKYFANVAGDLAGNPQSSLVVYALLWGHGGAEPMSCRIVSASIKHGDAMIGVGADAFHLRTDVSIQLRPWPLLWALGTWEQLVPGMTKVFWDWY